MSLLLLYNVMFILPLAAAFAAAYQGVRIAAMLQWSKRGVVGGKILLGLVFLVLFALLLTLN